MKAPPMLLLLALPMIAARRGLSSYHRAAAFGNPKYFTNRLIASDKPGVDLKVPDFPTLFDQICEVSPLAKQAFTDDNPGGFQAVKSSDDVHKWKVTDNTPKRLVSHVDKIDNFQNNGVPLLRLRSTLHGPAKKRGLCLSGLICEQDLRRRHDATCDIVDTIYSAASLDDVKELQANARYGEPTLFGVGYTKTKKSVVSPREQLTLCGLQEFASGASVTWGVELEEDQNYLFPKDQPQRMPRTTTHLLVMTAIPRPGEENDAFDVEYLLQIEIGGFPAFLTGPVVVDSVKKMFRFADRYFRSGFHDGGDLSRRLALLPNDDESGGDERANNSLKESPSPSPDAVSAAHDILDKEQTLLMPP